MTNESQRYNCFTRNGGNAFTKHAGPEAKGSNPTTGLTLLSAHNPFRGNFNHWQVSRNEAYNWTDYKTNAQIAKELKITPILDKLLEYKRSWIQHVNRMPRNRLPRVMGYYSPTGRRNHRGPLKRLLDTWDRNGSTSGPTPWRIYRVSQEECARLRESVPYVKLYRYNPKTYIQSWTVTEIMAREVWNFDSCYSIIDYQIHIETGRNMWFL